MHLVVNKLNLRIFTNATQAKLSPGSYHHPQAYVNNSFSQAVKFFYTIWDNLFNLFSTK